ncbi:mini-chromosome maintenance replisome factor-domain-containing protein [Syncephalis fuscata]|nr:mini-chromosome maintenance replisome factor-domain-containing protein [Syncephalis fuscata]
MVPTDLDSCINAPLNRVRQLFQENWRPDTPVEHTWGVPEYFSSLYDTEEKWNQIPSLNTLPPNLWRSGSLVRFRCMIQDTSFGQEIAVDASCSADGQNWQPHRYSDGADGESGVDQDASIGADALYAGQERIRLNELQLLYCVSIPCETDWVRRQYDEKMAARWGYNPLVVSSSNTTAAHQTVNGYSTQLINKQPIEEDKEHSRGVIVKVLGDTDAFKVADIVEFVGIYGTAPVIGDDLMLDATTETAELSPCIHAIFHKTLHSATETPLLISKCINNTGHLIAESIQPIELATTQHRVNTTTVGNLTLNLTKVQQSTDATSVTTNTGHASQQCSALAKQVHCRLASILPKCLALPMSLTHLNGRPFWPRDTGSGIERLVSGRLQLSDGTCVLIDETALDEGKLEDTGVRNVRTLARIVQVQQLDYAFPYRGEISFPTDLNLLIFSTARSMLPAEFVLPLQLTSPASHAVEPDTIHENILRRWREYLAMTRAIAHEIPESLSQLIQEDFVDRRKYNVEQGTPLMTEVELSQELLVARLIAQSKGEEKLNETHWQQAKRMEVERRSRLALL